MEKKNNGRREVNYLWLVAGAYLLYLGGDIILKTLRGEDGGGILSTLAAIVFLLAGIWLCLRELQAYRRGRQTESDETRERLDEEEP